MRTKRPAVFGIGAKVTLVFLLIIFVAFVITDARLTGFVRDYLYEQRIRQDSLSLEKLAVTVAPLFENGRSDALNGTLVSASGEMGGRLLVLDGDGKVQFDAFSKLMGSRLQLPCVVDVLEKGQSSSYAIHRLSSTQAGAGDGDTRVAYCAVRVTGEDGRPWALLYASPVAEMMDSLERVENQTRRIFLLTAAAAMIAAVLLSRLITRPINGLTRTINRMGQGDLSVRAAERGHDELRTLAENVNTMAEQLQTLDQARNQFVSNASHELKTPLATMKILLENVLYQPEMPEEMRTEFLTDMDHELDRLSNVVSDLLTLTRIDSRRIELKRERLNFTALTAETVRLLTPQAQQRNQTIRTRLAPDVTLVGDASKLGQIIYNLVENGLKYSQDGGMVRVELQVKGRSALLIVADNGVGIPKEDIDRIFERFYRVDKARSRDTGGTGLGLSIVRQLVQLHGGEISVKSEKGKGSVFTVLLPMEGKEERA
ncbi:MAG: HAMP domain-containing protein [Clostridia bacterium]|nr:HAMP domain-containing protein [Clostridia bacterium]